MLAHACQLWYLDGTERVGVCAHPKPEGLEVGKSCLPRIGAPPGYCFQGEAPFPEPKSPSWLDPAGAALVVRLGVAGRAGVEVVVSAPLFEVVRRQVVIQEAWMWIVSVALPRERTASAELEDHTATPLRPSRGMSGAGRTKT